MLENNKLKNMTNIFTFETKRGKQKGILSMYILNSLKKQSKSGYDLLEEIKEKTHGEWIPSKGTIYPLLKKLQNEKLIEIKTQGKRSKNIFQLTEEGKKTLQHVKKHGQQMEEKINQFRNLIGDLLSEEKANVISLIIEIRKKSLKLSNKHKKDVTKILKNCTKELDKLSI
jgi:DNA-binding PadR family transcriptional regulator